MAQFQIAAAHFFMQVFEEYFSFSNIVRLLAEHRSRLAFHIHKKSYHDRFCKGSNYNIKDPIKLAELDLLNSILRARKDWSRPAKHKERSAFSSSIAINKSSISNRVFQVRRLVEKGSLKDEQVPKWYLQLILFVQEMRSRVFDNEIFELNKPVIFPAKKNITDKTCTERRPIAKFSIRDSIILSLTNKYFTELFDPTFDNCSYAFRGSNSNKKSPTYHDAVIEIQKFRKKNINVPLYVAECDIKKFFDCVDHDIVINKFQELAKVVAERSIIIDAFATKIFNAYLSCYSFNEDVYKKNKDDKYWVDCRDTDPRGNFKWVEEFIHKVSNNGQKIGIPQGGALSGLIVNILMHDTDRSIVSNKCGLEYLYLRYCDDMVIIHTSPDECNNLFYKYLQSLESINLVYHNPAGLSKNYSKTFWKDNVKTRHVYSWSKTPNLTYPHSPWVSFLGYMIHVDGDLKIRKKSIEKQHQKHIEETKKLIKRLKAHPNEELLRNEYEIIRSFESRLFCMAVGRVDIGKYKSIPAQMCWGAGFRLIEDNKFTRAQLRKLDKSRKIQILILKKYIYKRLENFRLLRRDKSNHNDNVIEFQYPHSFLVYWIEQRQR